MSDAALCAKQRFGAKQGDGLPGIVGRSFAIPTKGFALETIGLAEIREYVGLFLKAAKDNPGSRFFVTRIGCGLAGYKDADIAPMFKGAPENCSFAEQWREYLEEGEMR